MPVEVVARNFRNFQRQVLTMGSDKLPVRSLEACAFVEDNIQSADEKSVWPDLWKRWNAKHPKERYATYNGFRQTYFRNMPKVIQSYKHPNLKPSPAIQKREEEFVVRLRRRFEAHGNQQSKDKAD